MTNFLQRLIGNAVIQLLENYNDRGRIRQDKKHYPNFPQQATQGKTGKSRRERKGYTPYQGNISWFNKKFKHQTIRATISPGTRVATLE